MRGQLLVVDDESSIRNLLQEFLTGLDYEVDEACDGIDALEKMEKKNYDLIISDINMPRMKGFELLANVREKYPDTKRCLITAYNVEDYFELAIEHDVGNIITKTTPFNFEEVEKVVTGILSGDVFGLERQMAEGTEVKKEIVTSPEAIDAVSSKIVAGSKEIENPGKLKLVVVEILTNAIFYGARNEDGQEKEKWQRTFTLSDEEAARVCWAEDHEKFGVSISDPFGRLTKRDVLYWLLRQTKKDDQGLPIGIFSVRGRGLYIARSYVDRLIINIKSGFLTEVIFLTYFKKLEESIKPLYINEV